MLASVGICFMTFFMDLMVSRRRNFVDAARLSVQLECSNSVRIEADHEMVDAL